MITAQDILGSIPPTAGSYVNAAEAVGSPVDESALGDSQVNGEHVFASQGLKLLDGKFQDTLERKGQAGDSPLAHIESIVNSSQDALSDAAKDIFAKKSSKPEIPEVDTEDHKELATKLNNLANNPNALIDSASKSTEALQSSAPKIASATHQALANAVGFLASKLPQADPGPFGDSYEPSKTEIGNFNRYKQIVNNPMIALSQVKDGSITPETTEVLQAVYPRLYAQMKQSIIEHLDKNASYQTKQSVSQFLGEPLDSSLTPTNVASLQGSYAGPTLQNAAPKTRVSKTGMAKLDVADRTSLQPKSGE